MTSAKKAHPRSLNIREDDPAAPYIADLLAYHLAELRSIMADFAFALDADRLSAADVTFWTAWRGNDLAGFAALKQLDPCHGELKSMRAAPLMRRSGVGRALLNHILMVARSRGYARLSLETGTAELHAPAIALYRSAGFVPCAAFADYRPSPFNQFLRLDIVA